MAIGLTINGIDGFLSGNWTIHPNAKVIDDETLELNATGDNISKITVNVQPDTQYTLFSEMIGNGGYVGGLIVNGGTNFGWLDDNVKQRTFITGSNQKTLELNFKRTTTGTTIFKRPMLNLGSTSAPYSKKTGDRMVEPVPKKNLYKGFVLQPFTTSGSVLTLSESKIEYTPDIIGRNGYVLMDVKPNTNYAVSFKSLSNTADNGRLAVFNSDASIVVSSYTPNNFVFNTGARSVVRLYFRNDLAIEKITFSDFQVEEGTVATPYEPYNVQVSKRTLALRRDVRGSGVRGGKNLFNGDYDLGYFGSNNAVLTYHATARTTKWIKCKPSTTYTFTGGNRQNWQVKNASGGIELVYGAVDSVSTVTTLSDSYEVRIYYSVDGLQTDLQLEEGSVSTPYEPYREKAKSSSGLLFNGTTDYLQLPSMTIDGIEIECLIQSKETGYEAIYDARQTAGGTDYFYLFNGSILNSGNLIVSDGVFTKGQRTKFKLSRTNGTSWTVNSKLFTRYDVVTEFTKATLYKVTYYLSGNVVAQYDFEKENSDVSSLIMGNPIWLLKQAKR